MEPAATGSQGQYFSMGSGRALLWPLCQLLTIVARSRTPSACGRFGELAIWNGKCRAATARCLEPSATLIVREHSFPEFLELVPEFEAMFKASTSAFATINVLMLQQQEDTPARPTVLPIARRLPSFTHLHLLAPGSCKRALSSRPMAAGSPESRSPALKRSPAPRVDS